MDADIVFHQQVEMSEHKEEEKEGGKSRQDKSSDFHVLRHFHVPRTIVVIGGHFSQAKNIIPKAQSSTTNQHLLGYLLLIRKCGFGRLSFTDLEVELEQKGQG